MSSPSDRNRTTAYKRYIGIGEIPRTSRGLLGGVQLDGCKRKLVAVQNTESREGHVDLLLLMLLLSTIVLSYLMLVLVFSDNRVSMG